MFWEIPKISSFFKHLNRGIDIGFHPADSAHWVQVTWIVANKNATATSTLVVEIRGKNWAGCRASLAELIAAYDLPAVPADKLPTDEWTG